MELGKLLQQTVFALLALVLVTLAHVVFSYNKSLDLATNQLLKEQQSVSWRFMQDFQFPELESLKLDFNSLGPYERLLMAHLLSMQALILSMQALESEGKLLPHSYMPQANNQYLSLERELKQAQKSTPTARLIQQDITLLTKLYGELSRGLKADMYRSFKN